MSSQGQPRRRGSAVRSFIWGGVVGGVIGVAAPALRRRAVRPQEDVLRTAGLRAFEGAPCWEYDHGRPPEASEGHAAQGDGQPAPPSSPGPPTSPDRALSSW